MEYYEIKDKDKPYNKRVRDGYPGEDLIRGDNSIFSCVWGAQFQVDDDVANNIGEMDKAKMGLCRPFKTLQHSYRRVHWRHCCEGDSYD